MNERIRELEKQCWSHYIDGVLIDGHLHFDTQKFAELIVWEAIGLCKVDVDALTGPFLSEYEKGVAEGYRRANENLRVHFGVEQ